MALWRRPATATLAADVPDNSVQLLPSASESSMVSLSGLIPCNTPRMAVAGISATASSSNALHLPISRIAGRYPFNGEMAYSPPLNPPLTTLEFYHRIAGRHFAPCPKNDKAGNTAQNASLRKHQARVKSGWLSAKNTGHQFDIRAVIVGQTLIPRTAKFTVSPSSTAFYLAQYGGWQRVANHHLHRDTTRQQKSYCDFFSHI